MEENINKKEEINFEIPGFIKKTIEFSNSFVEYAGKRIYYKDITGLSYHSIKESINYIPSSQSYYISIKDDNKKINVSFQSLLYIKNKNKKLLFSQLIYIVDEVLKPFLLSNLLDQLKKDESIKIDSLSITTDGLYKDRILRKPEFLAWYDYGFCKIEAGEMVVYKKDSQFSRVSLKEINAVILPEIAHYLKERKGVIPQEKTENHRTDFCANCGGKIKRGARFCTQCGKKI